MEEVDPRYLEMQLIELYDLIEENIRAKFDEFGRVWQREDYNEILTELFFCLLTPAARAHSAWTAVQRLKEKRLILHDSSFCSGARDKTALIARQLNTVRFRNNKARNIVEAEGLFFHSRRYNLREELIRLETPDAMREWLASTVRGMGFKEASHFLRNVGLYDDIAILDRHVLRNLQRLDIIEVVPEGLTKKKYLHVEGEMRELSKRMDIPLHHLDLLLWYRETGEIFK
jgi:N-glycosylase/DNA lyase